MPSAVCSGFLGCDGGGENVVEKPAVERGNRSKLDRLAEKAAICPKPEEGKVSRFAARNVRHSSGWEFESGLISGHRIRLYCSVRGPDRAIASFLGFFVFFHL